MTICASRRAVNGQEVKTLLAAATKNFANHVDQINAHNIFPVPDGDTGTNLYHTLQRAYREIANFETKNIAQIMQGFAYGALMGARGNSGTIFSQLLKGFADELPAADPLNVQAFQAACQGAVALAYAAVNNPVEGTILTVAREASESIQSDAFVEMNLVDLFAELLRAAEISLQNTPNLLPVLRQADVVDSGGLGLVVFLNGLTATNRAGTQSALNQHNTGSDPAPQPHSGAGESWGYDVQFLMRGDGLNIADIRRDLGQLGWSVLVVGNETTVKVHIHVENPAVPLDYAIKSGAQLDDIVVENMQLQYRQFAQGREAAAATGSDDPHAPDVAVVSVVRGSGLRAIFDDLRCARIINGGQGLNPSVEDIVETLSQLPNERIILLPNNRNIFLSARQAADLISDKDVRVLSTDGVLQGISAMIAYGDAVDNGADLDTLLATMTEAIGLVCSIEITRANRTSRIRDIEIYSGQYIALVDGEIRSSADSIDKALFLAFSSIDLSGKELATIYFGEDVAVEEATQLIERLSIEVKGLEFEAVYGGQVLYPYLIGLE